MINYEYVDLKKTAPGDYIFDEKGQKKCIRFSVFIENKEEANWFLKYSQLKSKVGKGGEQ